MTSKTLVIEDQFTRISFGLLVLAAAFGLAAGGAITMYYDLTPNMDARENTLSAVQQLLYLLPFLLSFIHLPAAVVDIREKLWRQAAIRVGLVLGMLLVILGTEGLISHFLWWSPLSDTDRFHMLHHTLIAGVPLTLAYGLAQRRWWRPASFVAPETLSLQSWLITGAILMLVFIALSGTVLGLGAPATGGAAVFFVILTILAIIVGRSGNR